MANSACYPHWTMAKSDIIKLFSSVEHIIKKGHTYIDLYKYDKDANLYELI